LWLLVLYPFPYYVTFVLPRYRHPIEPELLILIIYGVVGAFESRDQRSTELAQKVVS